MKNKMDMQTFKVIGPCITRLLFDVAQMHYTHFLTRKNHHHVVIGETYEEFEEDLDELTEQFLGTFVGDYKVVDLLKSDMMSKEAFYFRPIKEEKEILAYLDEVSARVEKGLSFVITKPELRFMQDTLSDLVAILKTAKYQIAQE